MESARRRGPFCYNALQKKSSLKNLSSISSSSSSSMSFARFEQQQQQPHFLEACFLCNKPLGYNRDIFMYRGDTPFCSEECRQEQIDMDEANEKKLNLSTSKALREKEQTTSPKNYNFPRGTVAAA